MFVRSALTATLIALAAPAFAGGVGVTHEAVAVPPGKIAGMAFRPIDQAHCGVAPKSFPAGGKAVHHAEPYSAAECDQREALKDEAKKRG